MPSWTISQLNIVTGIGSQSSGELYANGRMQVAVDVQVSADDGYRLTDAELDEISLVDYIDVYSDLDSNGEWIYRQDQNEFSDPLTTSNQGASQSSASLLDNSYQSKRFWVSTKVAEIRNIAALVIQPDGKFVSTCKGEPYDTSFSLVGRTPIVYTTASIKIDTAVKEASGSYHNDLTNPKWYQDSYYLSTKQFPLKRVETHYYDRTGSDNGTDSDVGLIGSYAKQLDPVNQEYDPPCNLNLFFIWEYGSQATKYVGLYKDYEGFSADAHAYIEVNRRDGAFCLTRLKFYMISGFGFVWGSEWKFKPWFILYDIHGNAGSFSATFSEDHDKVVILDYNKASLAADEKPSVITTKNKSPFQNKAEFAAALQAEREKNGQ